MRDQEKWAPVFRVHLATDKVLAQRMFRSDFILR